MYPDDPPPYASVYEQPYTITDGSTELRPLTPTDGTPIPMDRQLTELREEQQALTDRAPDPTYRHLDSRQESPDRALEPSHNLLGSSRETSQPVQDLPQSSTVPPEPTYNWPQPTYGPSTYRIGSSNLQSPLVNVAHVRAHLNLLSAFKKLRITIERNEILNLPPLAKDLSKLQRWSWFVNLAVDRFHQWAEVMHNANSLHIWDVDFIPPLDVLMVWHAYMLNPIWYTEDCERISLMQTFQEMSYTLLPTVMNLGDVSSFQPSHRLASFWLARTHTPFDPIEAAAKTTHRRIECSQCLAPVEVPYLTTAGTGYAQHSFSTSCPTCNHTVTKESLALTKFVKDLIAGLHVSSTEVPVPVTYLAQLRYTNTTSGTLHSHINMNDTSGAAKLKRNLLELTMFRRQGSDTDDDWRRTIQKSLRFSIKNVPRALYNTLTWRGVSLKRAINRVLNAYTDDRPFSVDLVGAGSFIDKMYEFGWTEPAFYQDEDERIVLEHAIARYHAFLDLISTSATPLYVPTLDIDLVWHSHQLMAKQYGTDCKAYVGRYIDHDLSSMGGCDESFADCAVFDWCILLQKRFGIAYMHCGCPPPDGTHSVGQYLRRLVAGHKQATETREDLVLLDRPDALSATHPSLHNAMRVNGSGSRVATYVLKREQAKEKKQKLEKRIEKERKRDEKLVREGSMSEAIYASRIAHDIYLAPIPFYRPAAACVVVSAPIGENTGNAAQCAVGAGACRVGNNGLNVGQVFCGSSTPYRSAGSSGSTGHLGGASGRPHAFNVRNRGPGSYSNAGLLGASGVAFGTSISAFSAVYNGDSGTSGGAIGATGGNTTCGGGTGASGCGGSGGGCGAASSGGGGGCGGGGGGGGCGGGGGGCGGG
ncbi:hypothetical protein WOLCODRAFT_17768 [Wolfiporia cocos MD-104 SS10]|uniref:Uncharacterized protein n=1 Tax=Wolfiporia cocos (strain MD-104) TaxID=742152 RepID=A0A2H3JRH4_WOLCO|nr:hypothetical protein WOLCODRAFT_17768 [Wolfiporia cocos MD-104 SS10]